jgi:hypothetical protein
MASIVVGQFNKNLCGRFLLTDSSSGCRKEARGAQVRRKLRCGFLFDSSQLYSAWRNFGIDPDCALHSIGIDADHLLDHFPTLFLFFRPTLAHLRDVVVERLLR